jgi:hypothetical protein
MIAEILNESRDPVPANFGMALAAVMIPFPTPVAPPAGGG